MDGLDFSLNGGIVDSEIQEFADWPDLVGSSMPHVSEYSLNAAVDYFRPVNDTFNFVKITVQFFFVKKISTAKTQRCKEGKRKDSTTKAQRLKEHQVI